MMILPLPAKLQAEHLNVMNFLNEIVSKYPSAISFAPGRPANQFCDITACSNYLEDYIAQQEAAGSAPLHVRQQIGQYGKTNGTINDLIARFLALDEAIHTPSEAIMVTNGAQEGMAILAAGLFQAGQDVLLMADPTYNGMTGIASILNIELRFVPTNDEGLDLGELLRIIQEVHAQGKKPRALYVVPDFSNPLGTSMPTEMRQRLLDIAAEQDLLLIEDNPYGMLAYDDAPFPTLKSLDLNHVVIYLGTFAKILTPGLRIGFLVADQHIAVEANSQPMYLAQELSKVKSLFSVNTSPLTQAIVGGMLLEQHYSLKQFLQPKIAFYRANRDQMLQSLETFFGNDPLLASIVTWNRPRGGFFLTVTLPFAFTSELLQTCTEEYGVICCPMSFFTFLAGHERQVRLSFSAVTQAQIIQGIERFWRFVRDTYALEGKRQ